MRRLLAAGGWLIALLAEITILIDADRLGAYQQGTLAILLIALCALMLLLIVGYWRD